LSQRIALVTGASRGIGRAIAGALAAAGHELILVARDAEKLAAVQASIVGSGGTARALTCDLADRAAVRDLIAQLADSPIGVLVNNAGTGGPFETIDQVQDATWDEVFHVNVRACFELSRALLPGMKGRGWGRIVNIASIYGQAAASHSSTYIAAKHAVIGYTRAIAAEWGAWGIRCNALACGFVATDMFDGASPLAMRLTGQIPAGRIGTVDDIAHAACFLASDQSDYVNGSVLTIDGGLSVNLNVGL